MKVDIDLEVDVNGEGIFHVNKINSVSTAINHSSGFSQEILSSFSVRLNKLFSKASVKSTAEPLKVIFHDLTGGEEAFELVARFCYNNGRIQITPANTCILYCIAQSMEMTEEISSSPSLIKQAEKSLEGMSYWSWPEILTALKQCQDSYSVSNTLGILDRVLDSLVARITTASDTSPSGSSPEASGYRISFDTKSSLSTKNSYQRAWWFEDLVILNNETMKKLVNKLVSQRVEHVTISRYLFYYLKCKCSDPTSEHKREVIETVIDLLYPLNRYSVSCKALFDVLRLSNSQSLSICCRDRLENMIGSQIDQVTLDSLLISSPARADSLYDVNLFLRILRHFLDSEGRTTFARLKKVGALLDLYMAEVAPDSCLKSSKFVALATALPDVARDSHDAVYRAIDMYLEVHNRLSEEEKLKICSGINYKKLSPEACKHLAQNSKFPSRTAVRALLYQQSKIKSLLQESSCLKSMDGQRRVSSDEEQIVLYAKKLDPSVENEKLKAHLQGMQWRVMELEKACRKMQNQMAKMMKNKTSNSVISRSLPKLCS
ncbi:BTB/POZ domain-containing protein [Apostasia shenzhenica]|uniref:BTB/POZ domain-containing protein n=1 Tax=Apostasia shenzhenica TaxID=1088818 RepID=A0A2I0AAQ1_9ASPA|nr:BTB/POZ domain-containing protein [Apostasia shenzhenica]